MKKLKIVTDSGSDLDKKLAEKYNISVLPIPLQIGKEEYKDRVDITPEQFYNKLRKTEDLPKTSQITPYTFKDKFNNLLKEYDKIIYISFSSQLSGIYNSAQTARKLVNQERIEVIDSKSASFGQGLIVLKAAQLVEEGRSKEEVTAVVNEMIGKMKHIFRVGSLEMLKKGGRISSTKAFIGSLLNINPILEVNKKGEIVPLDKVRGEKRLLNYFVEAVKEQGSNLKEQTIGISHADALELTKKLADRIKAECEVEDILITEIGPVIGSHAGPGTVALFFQ